MEPATNIQTLHEKDGRVSLGVDEGDDQSRRVENLYDVMPGGSTIQ
jgi:hypothetical protein